jgi:hypothetical protein
MPHFSVVRWLLRAHPCGQMFNKFDYQYKSCLYWLHHVTTVWLVPKTVSAVGLMLRRQIIVYKKSSNCSVGLHAPASELTVPLPQLLVSVKQLACNGSQKPIVARLIHTWWGVPHEAAVVVEDLILPWSGPSRGGGRFRSILGPQGVCPA